MLLYSQSSILSHPLTIDRFIPECGWRGAIAAIFVVTPYIRNRTFSPFRHTVVQVKADRGQKQLRIILVDARFLHITTIMRAPVDVSLPW